MTSIFMRMSVAKPVEQMETVIVRILSSEQSVKMTVYV